MAPHGAVNPPRPVTGFTGGELDGLIIHFLIICGLPGPSGSLCTQSYGPHTVESDAIGQKKKIHMVI